MDKFKLIDYTKNVMKTLADKDLYITHLNIAYKVISYYENNIDDYIDIDYDFLESVIHNVYEQYIENDDNDLLDQIVENMFKARN